MKRIRIAVALLVAVVGLCVITQQYQHRRIDALLTTLEDMETAWHSGDTVAATALAEEFSASLEKASNVMGCYVPHDALAESRETAALLPSLLQKSGQEELSMELCRLREQLNHLRQIDDPVLYNIL